MLLELLSDFQITIPELGRIAASSQPVVLLTSNNSRELTEALKRRCLYLWLDYPSPERELEIVRLHAPELPETVARKLIEVIGMVRELDLKKPPSIAESIDWARALLLLGARGPRRRDVPRDDVGDRQAPHRHRARRRARRARARVSIDAQLLELGEELRRGGRRGRDLRAARRVRGARPRSTGATARRSRSALAATLAKSPEERRVFDLVFERFLFRATEAAATARPGSSRPAAAGAPTAPRTRSTSRSCGRRSRRRSRERRRGAPARPRAPRDGGARAPARRSRRCRHRRAAHPPGARPAQRSAAGTAADDPRHERRCRATRCGASRRCCGASSSARRSSARRRCRRRGR